jgi:hypothetical protein
MTTHESTSHETSGQTRSKRRRGILVGSVVLGIVVITIGAIGFSMASANDQPALVARVSPLLPDLVIEPFSEFAGARDLGGNERLRFGVMIGNIGAGDFRLRARRSVPFADDWSVVQQIPEARGGITERATPADVIYGGDAHEHWHIRAVESHTLETLDGEVLGEVVKQGFCFFDTDAIGESIGSPPESAFYHSKGCGGRFDTGITMGLSTGWGDEYPWHLFDQQIDVTEVPDGTYRIRAVADAFDWFEELDETNNEYWEEFELTRDAAGIPDVRVIATSRQDGPPSRG